MDKRLLLVGLILAITASGVAVWMLSRPSGDAPGPVAEIPDQSGATIDEPPALQDPVDVPEPAQPVQPRSQVEAEPGQVERMFGALIKAAELGDVEGANEARRRLAAINDEEVQTRAAALLDQTRADDAEGAYATLMLRAGALYLVALYDPEAVFAWLTARWSEPRLTKEGRREHWDTYNRRPPDQLAALTLDREDEQEVAPIGSMLSWVQSSDPAAGALIHYLTERFRAGVVQDSLPDPWLSGVLRRTIINGMDVHAATGATFRDLLLVLRDNMTLSERLRAQVAGYLLVSPQSIHDLLLEIADAASVQVAAKALAEFLKSHTLTKHDVELLVSAIHQKFGSVPDGAASMLNYISSNGADGIPLDNLHTLVGALLSILDSGERSLGENLTMLEMVEGLRRSWTSVSARRVGAYSGVPMFNHDFHNDARRTLVRVFRSVQVPGGEERQNLARSRVMGLLWASPLSIGEKLEATTELLAEVREVAPPLANAVLTGLNRQSLPPGALGPEHGGALAECLDLLFAKWPDGLNQPRPYSGSGSSMSQLSPIARALGHCEYPPLTGRLWERLAPVASGLIEDSADWPGPGETGRFWFDYRAHLESVRAMYDAYNP
jgi:hypothetical protein